VYTKLQVVKVHKSKINRLFNGAQDAAREFAVEFWVLSCRRYSEFHFSKAQFTLPATRQNVGRLLPDLSFS